MEPHQSIYKAVLNSMEHGYVFIKPDAQITAYNDAACRILGLTGDELSGRRTIDSDWGAIREDGAEFPKRLHPINVSLTTGKPCFGVVMGIRAAGQVRWLLINSDVVRAENAIEPLGAVASFSDITVQINHKRYLERMLREMETTSKTVAQNANYLNSALLALTSEILALNEQVIKASDIAGGAVLENAVAVSRKAEKLAQLLAQASAA